MSEQVVPVNVSVENDRSEEVRAGKLAGARSRRETAANISEPERLASAIAGGFLALYGVRKKGWGGLGLAVAGAELLRRGVTGHCMAYDALGVSTRDGTLKIAERQSATVDPSKAIKARGVVTIQRARAELYRMWRDFSQLPTFMHNLERVDVLSPTRSHWVTKGPAGTKVEWDAEIVAEREGEYIEWASMSPADVPNRGTVQFVDSPLGDGTEVIVTLEVEPPAGRVGDLIARAFGKSPQQEVTDAVQRFRETAERGSAASNSSFGVTSSSSASSTSTSSTSFSGSSHHNSLGWTTPEPS
ncbi:MAG: SRPBCC family protein [Gemmatimonadaceae bacterium]